MSITLYHGTTIENMKKIKKDSQISANISGRFDDPSDPLTRTKKGFVYLSNEVGIAAGYGHGHTIDLNGQGNNFSTYGIIKIQLEEEQLLNDETDLKLMCHLGDAQIKKLSVSDNLKSFSD